MVVGAICQDSTISVNWLVMQIHIFGEQIDSSDRHGYRYLF